MDWNNFEEVAKQHCKQFGHMDPEPGRLKCVCGLYFTVIAGHLKGQEIPDLREKDGYF